MAEDQNPVTQGELVEIIRRLNERISSMDRNINDRIVGMEIRFDERLKSMDERISTLDRNMNQRLTEMRTDLRMLNRFVLGFYGALLAICGVAFTLYKLFPNVPPPTP